MSVCAWHLPIGLGVESGPFEGEAGRHRGHPYMGHSDLWFHSYAGPQKGFLLGLNLRPSWKPKAREIPRKVMQRNGPCGDSQAGGPDRGAERRHPDLAPLCSNDRVLQQGSPQIQMGAGETRAPGVQAENHHPGA